MKNVLEERKAILLDQLEDAFYAYYQNEVDNCDTYDEIEKEIQRVDAILYLHQPKVITFCKKCDSFVLHNNFDGLCEKCWNWELDRNTDF